MTSIPLKLSCHICFHRILGGFRTSSVTFCHQLDHTILTLVGGVIRWPNVLLFKHFFYRTQVHIYNQMNIHITVYKIPLESKRMEKKQVHFQKSTVSAASMALPVLPPWSGPAHRAQPGRPQMLRSRPLRHAEDRWSLEYENVSFNHTCMLRAWEKPTAAVSKNRYWLPM